MRKMSENKPDLVKLRTSKVEVSMNLDIGELGNMVISSSNDLVMFSYIVSKLTITLRKLFLFIWAL